MPLEEVKDMTWAEFELRSFQYWEDRKREELLERETAYWSYRASMIFSKERPMTKQMFWKIDGDNKKVSEEVLEHFKNAREEYLKGKK